MKAVKCPVCDGSGKYKKKECHGCAGKGWVSVGIDYPPYNPYPIYPDPCPVYPDKWTYYDTETTTGGDYGNYTLT